MNRPNTIWDPLPVHRHLWQLTLSRARFRVQRTIQRLRSPRRIIATVLAVAFMLFYLFNGIVILSAREPADPARLRLWLSGGMVIYAIYHFVRCVWTTRVADLELTDAESLWLGGAPVQRSSLAVYHIAGVMFACLVKTLLLAVVLARDVNRFELLVIGVFGSLVLLETMRLVIQRWSAGLDRRGRLQMRAAATAVTVCVVLQVITRVLLATPFGSPTWLYVLNSFSALGETAACSAIQMLSLPWIASAELAVAQSYSLTTIFLLLMSATSIPLAIILLVHVDAWAGRRRLAAEQHRFATGGFVTSGQARQDSVGGLQCDQEAPSVLRRMLPETSGQVLALTERQSVSVRRYWGTIVFSFAIPLLLCLSPLMTGQVTEQWLFVIGGIALCTVLLAPPALRLDFRRDLKRMMLLKSLPVAPLKMVLGQLMIPIWITLTFQWLAIAVAAVVVSPGPSQIILWTGMLGALAVFTFAAENALFLAYPHHERAEGIAMMIRAKLTFLGKTALIAGAVVMLLIWNLVCRHWLPTSIGTTAYVAGAIIATWAMALLAVGATSWCWRRFDLAHDVPPQ